MVFVSVLAGLAVVFAAIALAVVVTRDDPADPSPAATATGAPQVVGGAPTGVTLGEAGGYVTLRWRDPAEGRVSFLVAGGRRGEQLQPMAQLGPGTTRYTLNGLNPRLDYCFTVVAVYGPDAVAPAPQVCTDRAGATGGPQPDATG